MQMVAEILQHVVQRPEDYLENIENIVKLYKEIILHPLEVRTRYIVKNTILIFVFSHWLNSFHIFHPLYYLILHHLILIKCC